MVAPRSLTEPTGRRTSGAANGIIGEQAAAADRLARLAVRWVAAAPAGEPAMIGRLTTLLRRLAATVKSEPFWPLAARDIGADLLASGLCGPIGGSLGGPDQVDDADAAAIDPEDALPLSLALLRREAPAAFGVATPEGERRVAMALDEVAAGFAGAMRRAGAPTAEKEVPTFGLNGGSRAFAVRDLHYRAVYDNAGVGIGIGTLDGYVLDLNPALCRMFGLSGPLEEPRPASDFIHPDDLADVIERHRRLITGEPDVMRLELRLVRPDSVVLWAHVATSLVRDEDGKPSHIMALVEDVSERHRLRSRLQQATSLDQLTRLPSQALTDQWLHRAFAGGATRIGICALDLDGFHAINDALGDHVGDRLLLGVVGRLQLAAGNHLVTRTGSDEFTVLVGDPESAGEVCRIADRVQAALATPFDICGRTVSVTASIGVAEGEVERTSAAELMRSADIARSWAKALGGGRRVVFDHERDAGEAARFELLSGLRGAIDRGEFRLAYQPLVSLSGGQLQGVEALIRWQHPMQGLIGPGRFIELAEHSGAIVPLGRWVLEVACAAATSWWRTLGPSSPYVSVNVSPLQLAEPGWVREVTDVLEATGLPPDRLQLEITEQAVLGDEATALDALSSLREVGVRLALDDFGTGYSSLAWLRRLPVHTLKIDGSFIDGLRHPVADPVDASIVRALVEMAHALGLEVTAEWVETIVQAERLSELGCDTGQGRWFGDAGPGEWVPELYRRSITS